MQGESDQWMLHQCHNTLYVCFRLCMCVYIYTRGCLHVQMPWAPHLFSSRALFSTPDVQSPMHELWEAVRRRPDVSLRVLHYHYTNLPSVDIGESEAAGDSEVVGGAD